MSLPRRQPASAVTRQTNKGQLERTGGFSFGEPDQTSELTVISAMTLSPQQPPVQPPVQQPTNPTEWLRSLTPEQVEHWYSHDPAALCVGAAATLWWNTITQVQLTLPGFHAAAATIHSLFSRSPLPDLTGEKIRCAMAVGLHSGEWFYRRAFDSIMDNEDLFVQPDDATPESQIQVARVLASIYSSAVLADISPEWSTTYFHFDHLLGSVIYAALDGVYSVWVDVYSTRNPE